MPFIGELAGMMVRTMASALLNPFFWVVVALVFVQYRRMNNFQQKLFGLEYHSVWRQTMVSIGFGFLGGLLGSVLLLLFGLSLNDLGIAYIWPVALLLLLINPRFLCFAYAGGIVAFASLLVRGGLSLWPEIISWPFLAGLSNINLPSLVSLVGVLHLTEAFLIFLSGHINSSPVYVKSSQGEIVGGYSMQRFWPLPLVGLWVVAFPADSQYVSGGVSMPDWWPLVGSTVQPGAGEELIYMMVPLVAGLGYGDLALSSTPENKKNKSAGSLAVYSIALILLSLAANNWPYFLLPAVLAAPLGHEFLVQYSSNREKSRLPLYRYNGEGVKVLTIAKGSPAYEAGLQPEDIIINVNGLKVENSGEVEEALKLKPFNASIFVLRKGKPLTINYPGKGETAPTGLVGLIYYPDKQEIRYLQVKQPQLKKKWRRLTRRLTKFFQGKG